VNGLWLRDVITEGTYEGHHTKQVQTGLIIGFVLFILVKFLLSSVYFGLIFMLVYHLP